MPASATSPVTAPAAKDRKSTRLNSSHSQISYAVFCLKKKKVTHAALAGSDIATMPFCLLKMPFEDQLTVAEQKNFLDDYSKPHESKPVLNTSDAPTT